MTFIERMESLSGRFLSDRSYELIVAPAIGRYFHEPSLVGIVRAMAAAFVLNGIGAPSAFVLSREMAFRQRPKPSFWATSRIFMP